MRDPEDLAPALSEALASDSVALVDVVTDPDVISPSALLSELVPETGTSYTSPG